MTSDRWSYLNPILIKFVYCSSGTLVPTRVGLKWPRTSDSCWGSRRGYLQRHSDAQVIGILAKWGKDRLNNIQETWKFSPLCTWGLGSLKGTCKFQQDERGIFVCACVRAKRSRGRDCACLVRLSDVGTKDHAACRFGLEPSPTRARLLAGSNLSVVWTTAWAVPGILGWVAPEHISSGLGKGSRLKFWFE